MNKALQVNGAINDRIHGPVCGWMRLAELFSLSYDFSTLSSKFQLLERVKQDSPAALNARLENVLFPVSLSSPFTKLPTAQRNPQRNHQRVNARDSEQ